MTSHSVPALLFECESPPEPFDEEFPLVGSWALFETGGGVVNLYVPEDDQHLTDPSEILQWIYKIMPISHFKGGAQINIHEEDDE
jgi:hypothetical protein